jgi:parallel beta-helix repeat protein
MNTFRFTLRAAALVIFALASTSFVHAQATRTWVSGVGDDANPCSRTAPCKTFAGAISKTATNGEIDVLDPGGFGALSINKGITINGTVGSGFGSVLVSAGNGINVNAAGATVTLRHLEITGVGGGARGVSVTAVGTLNIEDSTVVAFQSEAVFVSLGTGANVNIKGSTFKGNGLSNVAGAGAGLRVTTSDATFGVGHTVYVTVENSSADNNNEGYRIENNVRATIRNSTASNNSLNGFDVFPGAAASDINLEGCVSANNKQWGVFAGGSGTARLSNCTITNNSVLGVNSGGGSILTYSNNKIQGNGPNGTQNGSTTGTAPQN